MKSLDMIYPNGSFLATRLSVCGAKWIPSSLHTIESMTGNLLACAGDLPLLVHRSVMAPAGLSAMESCGLSIARKTDVFATPSQYEARIRKRCELGQTPAYSYSQSDGASGHSPALVKNDILQFLNNKQNIAIMANRMNVAARVSANQHIAGDFKDLKVPIVLKVATDDPNAGGAAVFVCRKRRHLKRAAAKLHDAQDIIAEQYIKTAGSWCIQFAVLPDGTVQFSGASQQICLSSGAHAGSLIEVTQSPSEITVEAARQAICVGAQKGFRGICGVDVLVDPGGAAFVIDLNFRPVSSTAFVYEYARRFEHGTGKTARLAFCHHQESLDKFLDTCKGGFEEGWLVPLATFDPDYGDLPPGPSRIRMMIIADGRDALMERERQLLDKKIMFVPIAGTLERRSKWRRSVSRFFRR